MNSSTRSALIAHALVWAREADGWLKKQGVTRAVDGLCDWDLPLYRAVKRYEREMAAKRTRRKS